MSLPPSRRILALAFAASLFVGLAACQSGRKTLPKTTVNVVDAAPTLGSVSFVREERDEASLDFRATSGALSFDTDTYAFHVDVTPPGATAATRLATFSKTLAQDTDYLFVLAEENGAVEPISVESPAFSSTTQTQVAAVHAAASLPAMDIYIVAPGADPASASPLGSVSFKDSVAPSAMDPGDYQVVLTEAGNPANIEFRSPTITLDTGQSNVFVVVGDPTDPLAPLAVVDSGPAAGLLLDQNASAGLELVNGVTDGAARDIYLDDDFTAPIAAALPSPGVSTLLMLPAGSHSLSVTPAGNPGAVELEQTLTASQGSVLTEFVSGDPGSLSATAITSDRRTITGQARIRFMNGATLFSSLDMYLEPPGTDITTVLPQFELAPEGLSDRVALAPGDYELTVKDPSTGAVVAGPQALTLAEGLFTILLTNGQDSSTAGVVLLQGFQ